MYGIFQFCIGNLGMKNLLTFSEIKSLSDMATVCRIIISWNSTQYHVIWDSLIYQEKICYMYLCNCDVTKLLIGICHLINCSTYIRAKSTFNVSTTILMLHEISHMTCRIGLFECFTHRNGFSLHIATKRVYWTYSIVWPGSEDNFNFDDKIVF